MKILSTEGILLLKGPKTDNYGGEITFWLLLLGKTDDISLL